MLSDLGSVILQADDSALNHLVVQIVSFTRALSHSSEHGVTTMSLQRKNQLTACLS